LKGFLATASAVHDRFANTETGCGECDNANMSPSKAKRVACALWIVLAIVVWNVVFDRVLVLAARQYVYAATVAARGEGPFLLIDDWMRPAVRRGVLTASLAGGAVLVVGLGAVALAMKSSIP
jgi:hypothetical protein